MTTSGTFSFTVTRDDLIRESMLNIGRLDAYGTIDPIENTDIARKLNMLAKQWQGKSDMASGLKIWTRQRGDLFLSSSQYLYNLGPTGTGNASNWAAGVTVSPGNGDNFNTTTLTSTAAAGTNSLNVTASANFTAGDYIVLQLNSGDIYSGNVLSVGSGIITLTGTTSGLANTGAYVWNYTTKGQRPLEIVTAILRDQDNSDTPLDRMSIETYEALPTKTAPTFLSDPTAWYYEAQLTNGNLYLDVAGAQDITKQIHIVYLQPIQDFNNPLDNPEYSAEWFNALAWGLSKQICPMFNAPWSPLMEDNYIEAVKIAREVNPDTTEIYFQPNQSQA